MSLEIEIFPDIFLQLLPPRCIFGKFNQCYIVGQIGKLSHLVREGGHTVTLAPITYYQGALQVIYIL